MGTAALNGYPGSNGLAMNKWEEVRRREPAIPSDQSVLPRQLAVHRPHRHLQLQALLRASSCVRL